MKRVLAIVTAVMLAYGCAADSNDGEYEFSVPLLFCRIKTDSGSVTELPFLYVATSRTNGLETVFVKPLFWYEPGKEVWLIPFFNWCSNGTMMTLLGGRSVDGGVTNVCITPFVGITSGKNEGGWVFPFWKRKTDRDFHSRLSLLDESTLPEDVSLCWVSDEREVLMLWNFSDCVHSQIVHEKGDTERRFCIKHSRERPYFGVSFSNERTVEFDMSTRRKISDSNHSRFSFLEIYSSERWRGGAEHEDRHVASILKFLFRKEVDSSNGTTLSVLGFPIWHSEPCSRYAEGGVL